MVIKILFKEWRENIIIFSIAILLMLTLVALSLSNQRELTLYFSGMFLLLFLPFAALLIGSGGFYSEFKDNAWIYLFSRPIKKWLIWVFKYVSLLSILLVIFLIFFLVKQFLPGLDEILKDINFQTEIRALFSFSLYFVLPLLAFTISFSISILTEKQFVIFFGSILIGTGLAFLFQRYLFFLWINYYYYGSFKSFALFIAFSFILASILTFVKADFSQIGKKILTFSKFIVLFLVLSFALGTVWIAKGDLFSGSKEFYPVDSYKHQGNVFLASIYRGIFKYDSKIDRVEKLGRKFWLNLGGFSIAGDKIAFFKYSKEVKNRWYESLRVINSDGSHAKALIESHKPESPFHNLEFSGNCLLSPDGSKVSFLTASHDRKLRKTTVTVWRMKVDGTDLRSQTLDFPSSYSNFQIIAWPELTNSLFIMLEEKSPSLKKLSDKIVKVDFEKGTYQVLIENVKGELYRVGISQKNDLLPLYILEKLENKEVFVVLNLRTLEKKEVLKADLLKLWAAKWNQDGEKIAFSRDKELWVYSLAGNRAQKISRGNYNYGSGFDWLADGKRLAVIIPIDGEYHVSVLDENFKEEKKIRIPFPIEGPFFIWGLENKVLVKFRKSPIWRVNLETGEWKKLY